MSVTGSACLDTDALMAFVDGSASSGERRNAEEHFAACDDCRAVLAEIARSSMIEAPVEPVSHGTASVETEGGRIGRYHLLEPIGAGGMGVVHAAYDPDLDRKIALKLLRPGVGAATGEESAHAGARLLHEAQAIARVTHPNVVSVHDVGMAGSEVFVAMEFVDGGTLARWLRAGPHPWREVRDRFLKAGRGLAAAHAAGLVHRDFKPDNVLLGKDGRVRVADFGLARPTEETSTGVVVGTPAYMAPEQRAGGAVDARSDQFSYCVALNEALQGKAPPWLRRMLARGLAEDPAARYPAMEPLLAALGRDPARTRRRWAAGVTLAAAIAGGSLLAPALLAENEPEPCAGAAREVERVWNDDRRRVAAAAFRATEISYAGDAWSAAARALDEHAARWRAMYTDACEDTHVRHEQSAELLDARMACLARHREEVDALVSLFEHADGPVVENAGKALSTLGGSSECEDPGSLVGVVKAADARTAQRALDLERRLARAEALSSTGKYAEGLELVRPIAVDARALGHAPTLAAALEVLGGLEDTAGDPVKAAATHEEAVWQAIAGRDQRRLAEACLGVMTSLGKQARWDDAMVWHRRIEEVEALVGPGQRGWLEARRMQVAGNIMLGQGKNAEAEASYRRLIEIAPRMAGGGYLEGRARLNLGVALNRQERLEEARVEIERAIELIEATSGAGHPHAALGRMNLSSVLAKAGAFERALAEGQRALEIQERVLGPEHEQLAFTLVARAGQLRAIGRDEEALAALERARALLVKTFGPAHPRVAEVHTGMGDALVRSDGAAAIGHYREAVRILEAPSGPDPVALGEPLVRLASALTAAAPKEALPLARRALAIHQRVLGPEHPQVAIDLSAVAAALRGLRRFPAAVEQSERALALYAAHGPEPFVRAGIELDLAQALWETGQRARARELVAGAAVEFDRAGPRGASRRDEVARWRARNDPAGAADR